MVTRREPVLTEPERQSALWQKLKKHFEARLQRARERNDSKLDSEATNRMRGRIAELKHLVALDQPAPQTEADDLFKD